MAELSGTFTGPTVTDSVSYAEGDAITFTLRGEWPRAIINTEVSHDAGATWLTAVWIDLGIEGASYAPYDGSAVRPLRAPGSTTCRFPGAGLFRLRCVEFRSGWCNWAIKAP